MELSEKPTPMQIEGLSEGILVIERAVIPEGLSLSFGVIGQDNQMFDLSIFRAADISPCAVLSFPEGTGINIKLGEDAEFKESIEKHQININIDKKQQQVSVNVRGPHTKYNEMVGDDPLNNIKDTVVKMAEIRLSFSLNSEKLAVFLQSKEPDWESIVQVTCEVI